MDVYEEFGIFQPCQAGWHLLAIPNVLGALTRGQHGLRGRRGEGCGAPGGSGASWELSVPRADPGPVWREVAVRVHWTEQQCPCLCDVLVTTSRLCLMAPGPFGDMGVSGTSSTPKLVMGSRGEVGRGLKCAPRRGQGCDSRWGSQKLEGEKQADHCSASEPREAAALG